MPENVLEIQSSPRSAVAVTPCQMAVGWVIFDAVCLAVGAVGVRAGASASAIQAVAEAAAPVVSAVERTVAQIARQGATLTDQAWGVFTILKTIWNGGCLSAVFSAFTNSLTWWDMILYGITGTATIIAALATDGIAFVAEVVILLATFGFLVSDSVKAVQQCGLRVVDTMAETEAARPASVPTADVPFPYEPRVALRTANGHTVTVVNNGGLDSDGKYSMSSNRTQIGPWETFTFVPIDANKKTFALKTSNGNYLTAVGGGGKGGPNDPTSSVHTDATWVGPWETLVFRQLVNGSFAICTNDGFYLTAVNGGGWGEGANAKPIHTDATKIGPWETFTLQRL